MECEEIGKKVKEKTRAGERRRLKKKEEGKISKAKRSRRETE